MGHILVFCSSIVWFGSLVCGLVCGLVSYGNDSIVLVESWVELPLYNYMYANMTQCPK